MLLMRARQRKTRIVCGREIQTSIKDSVHQLLVSLIFRFGWQYEFKITERQIRHKENESLFTFVGLKNNPESVKSTEGIDLFWIEEGQTISHQSMRLLIPTVRKEGSEIWISMNPRYADDYVYERFIMGDNSNCLAVRVNFIDNPWFPEVLRQEMEYDKEHDYELYRHTWEGQLRPHGERPLFSPDALQRAGAELSREPPDIYGLDLSWSGDNALTGISESTDRRELFIHTLSLKSKIPLRKLSGWIGHIDKKIVVDSARPEVIDMLREDGFNVTGSKKGAGSVKKGTDKIARYDKIWFADGTEAAMKEFSELGFDDDDDLVGKRDCFDSVRYALERIGGGFQTISRYAL